MCVVQLSGDKNNDEESDPASIFEPTEQGAILEGKVVQLVWFFRKHTYIPPVT
jgi:hypothetical protein